MNDEHHRKHKKYWLLALFALIIAFVAYAVADEALNQQIAFEIVKNNTDLCTFNHTTMLCDGSRQNNVTYYTNNTPLVLYVFAHASAAGGVAGVFVYRDDKLIAAQSGRPLASPEQTWREVTAIIPKNSSYRVNFTDFHHFEWYEDQILSGRNGTLSINQTVISGAGCTGNCSFNTILVNAIGKNLSVFPYFENIELLAPLKSINGTSENQLDLGNASNTHFDLSSTDTNFVASVSGNGTSGEVIISIDDAFKRSYNFNQSRLSLGGANLTDCANCGGNQNLSQVLAVGNDAGSQNITNVRNISMNGKLCISTPGNNCYNGIPFTDALYMNSSLLKTPIFTTQIKIDGISDAPAGYAYAMHIATRVAPINISKFVGGWGVGFYSNAQCDTSINGDFSNCASGFLASLTKIGSGNITNAYGLYIQNQSIGNTTNYGIYSAGTNPSYMAGNLTLNKLSGVGNAYVCVDSSGTLYRGNPGC